jgi:AraC-like DNA-binding protein
MRIGGYQAGHLPVRRGWLFRIAREAQLIALDLCGDQNVAEDLLRRRLARWPARSPCEQMFLDGIIVSALQRKHAVTSRSDLVERAAQLLHDQYTQKWTVPSLARALSTNRTTLTNEFRRVFGVGPHNYLRVRRLTVAQEAILAGAKVEAAALLAGFRSKSGFYEARRRMSRLRVS